MYNKKSSDAVLLSAKKSNMVCELDNIAIRDHPICRVCTILVGKEHYVKKLYSGVCIDCIKRKKI